VVPYATAMRTLVTGAAGFIGSQLVRKLTTLGHVIGIDDLSTGSLANLDGTDIELHIGSILDRDLLAAAVADCDAVVHLAARPSVPRSIADPIASHDANATGTLNVLKAARDTGDPLVIVASSSSVYGSNPTIPKHEQLVPMPMSPYAVSKLATEQYAIAWQHSYGLDTLAFRFFNVFGPHQAPGHAYAAVVPAFVHAALTGQPVTIHGDGLQSRDFTYVGTLCDVIVDAITRRVHHPWPVNLAFGTRTTLLELLDQLESILGRPIERSHIGTRTGDVRHSQADNTLLRDLFPDIKPVNLHDGLAATVDWMRTLVGE
jgi:UDP-glucose 4-epimerase